MTKSSTAHWIEVGPVTHLSAHSPHHVLQRQCACGQHSGKGEFESCHEKREGMLQRAAINSSPVNEVPPIVHEVLRSPGQPLDTTTRAFIEPRFGYDFSQVRVHTTVPLTTQAKLSIGQPGDKWELEANQAAEQIIDTPATDSTRAVVPNSRYDFSGVRMHTDAKAARSAQAVNALAYTVGNNIVFGTEQYRPGTREGFRLLAHELTHVIQQNGSNTTRINRAEVADRGERRFWLSLGEQPRYNPLLPKDKRMPIATNKKLNLEIEQALWIIEAYNLSDNMRTFLKSKFGGDKDLRVTSVIKQGEHAIYRKMDVVPDGSTTWEELAAAAVHAGFWVHAEGVELGGKIWPLSPKANGAHLDLYLIKRQVGDFPTPKDAPIKEEDSTSQLTE